MDDVLGKTRPEELRRTHGSGKVLVALNPSVQQFTKKKMRRLADSMGVSSGEMLDRLFAEMEIGPDGVPSDLPATWATQYLNPGMELPGSEP